MVFWAELLELILTAPAPSRAWIASTRPVGTPRDASPDAGENAVTIATATTIVLAANMRFINSSLSRPSLDRVHHAPHGPDTALAMP